MEARQGTRVEDPQLGERVAELRRRMHDATRRFDLRREAADHPWELVGAAGLLGAWLALAPRRHKPRERPPGRGRLGAMVLSGLGALAIRLAREAALRRVGQIARRWWDETEAQAGASEPRTA
jgi:hypothetical protein